VSNGEDEGSAVTGRPVGEQASTDAVEGQAGTGHFDEDRPSRHRRRHVEKPTVPPPPVRPPPWKAHYIPVYFWLGGIAGGSWLAATLEDLAGAGDRTVIRAGRYLAAGSTAAGATLLILDLGRPERFLNMLRVVRPRSAMSLGSWALAGFSAMGGGAALLQAAEDGLLGRAPRLGRWSAGLAGRLLHLAGLPVALFVGSYTGALVASSSVPAWAARHRLLPALFVASSASTGLAAVSAAVRLAGGATPGAQRRLERAESVALAVELGLAAADQATADLPSRRAETAGPRSIRWLTYAAGIAAPLALEVASAVSRRGRSAAAGPRAGAPRPKRGAGLLAAGLALAGGLALRLLVTSEGRRSAATPEDTWHYAVLERGAADTVGRPPERLDPGETGAGVAPGEEPRA
jgi:formate-dependent nitrite reductase membrane component NrfD